MATTARRPLLEVPLEPAPAPRPRPRPPQAGVGRFWLRVALFWAPVVALVGGFELVLWRTGDNWSIAHVIAYQEAHPEALWLRGMLDQALYSSKLTHFERSQPAVVAAGTSRVMEFRAAMLGVDPAEFYNLGGMLQNLGDLDTFARLLPARGAPRLIVLGIDMHWLNPSLLQVESLSRAHGHDPARNWRQHVFALRAALSGQGASQLLRALRAPAARAPALIGVEARGCLCGFRADGSMDYGRELRPAGAPFFDQLDPPVVYDIRHGTGRFPFASGVGPARLDSVLTSLRLLRSKGSTVLVFLPPVWSGAARALASEPRQAGLWRDYLTTVPAALRAAGFPVVDASTPERLGLTDADMIDGTHGDEHFVTVLAERLLELPGAAAARRPRS